MLRRYGKSLARHARFVRVGMALIVLIGLARFTAGVMGVPYEPLICSASRSRRRSWPSSTERARPRRVAVLGAVIATALGVLVIYGIAVTTGTVAPTRGHLQLFLVGVVVIVALSAIGFAVAKRQVSLAGAVGR